MRATHLYVADNPDSEVELKPLSIKELRDITSIVKDSHEIVRSILGEKNTQSLLEDIQADMIAKQKNKEISKTRLKELTKQLQDADKLKEELEMRKKEIQKTLQEQKDEQ